MENIFEIMYSVIVFDIIFGIPILLMYILALFVKGKFKLFFPYKKLT